MRRLLAVVLMFGTVLRKFRPRLRRLRTEPCWALPRNRATKSASGKISSRASLIRNCCATTCSGSARALIMSARPMTKTTPSGFWPKCSVGLGREDRAIRCALSHTQEPAAGNDAPTHFTPSLRSRRLPSIRRATRRTNNCRPTTLTRPMATSPRRWSSSTNNPEVLSGLARISAHNVLWKSCQDWNGSDYGGHKQNFGARRQSRAHISAFRRVLRHSRLAGGLLHWLLFRGIDGGRGLYERHLFPQVGCGVCHAHYFCAAFRSHGKAGSVQPAGRRTPVRVDPGGLRCAGICVSGLRHNLDSDSHQPASPLQARPSSGGPVGSTWENPSPHFSPNSLWSKRWSSRY